MVITIAKWIVFFFGLFHMQCNIYKLFVSLCVCVCSVFSVQCRPNENVALCITFCFSIILSPLYPNHTWMRLIDMWIGELQHKNNNGVQPTDTKAWFLWLQFFIFFSFAFEFKMTTLFTSASIPFWDVRIL